MYIRACMRDCVCVLVSNPPQYIELGFVGSLSPNDCADQSSLRKKPILKSNICSLRVTNRRIKLTPSIHCISIKVTYQQ